MKLKHTLAIAALVLIPLVAACTPHQIQVFKSLNPEQQQAVLDHYSRQYEKSQRATDCYSAARKHFPQSQWNKAYQIINRESGGNPRAKNPSSSAAGCFQILRGSWRHPSISFNNGRFNPDANARAARVLWNSGGWYCTCTWALTA